MKKVVLMFLLAMAGLSVSAKDIREFTVTPTPKMTCANCENKIKKNIRFEKGVSNIKTDLKNQVITVTYDADKTSEEALTAAFAKLKYKVKKVESTNSVVVGGSKK